MENHEQYQRQGKEIGTVQEKSRARATDSGQGKNVLKNLEERAKVGGISNKRITYQRWER